MKIEGYWYSEHTPQYDMPLPNVLSEEEADEIFRLIKAKENDNDTRLISYRGISISRIEEGVVVGNREYKLNGWNWPAGFAEHYVLKHKVRPTDEFLEFIGYEAIVRKSDDQQRKL